MFLIKRGAAATKLATVLYVVMNQKCVVQKLDSNGGIQGLAPAAAQCSTCGKAKRSAEALGGPAGIRRNEVIEVRRTFLGDRTQQITRGSISKIREDPFEMPARAMLP